MGPNLTLWNSNWHRNQVYLDTFNSQFDSFDLRNLQESQKLAQKKVEGREKSEKSESVKSGKSEKPKSIFMRLESPIFGHLDAYFNAISWENVYFLKRYTKFTGTPQS